MTNDYSLIDLKSENKMGRKWVIGPFCNEVSPGFSTQLEIGFVDLMEVEKTDVLHKHTIIEEYYLVIEGEMLIKVGSENLIVSEKQILIVKPNTPHLILKVKPHTKILLIKSPPGCNDKVNINT